MPDPTLLPPPPKKRTAVTGELLPPPPKKKGETGLLGKSETGGEIPLVSLGSGSDDLMSGAVTAIPEDKPQKSFAETIKENLINGSIVNFYGKASLGNLIPADVENFKIASPEKYNELAKEHFPTSGDAFLKSNVAAQMLADDINVKSKATNLLEAKNHDAAYFANLDNIIKTTSEPINTFFENTGIGFQIKPTKDIDESKQQLQLLADAQKQTYKQKEIDKIVSYGIPTKTNEGVINIQKFFDVTKMSADEIEASKIVSIDFYNKLIDAKRKVATTDELLSTIGTALTPIQTQLGDNLYSEAKNTNVKDLNKDYVRSIGEEIYKIKDPENYALFQKAGGYDNTKAESEQSYDSDLDKVNKEIMSAGYGALRGDVAATGTIGQYANIYDNLKYLDYKFATPLIEETKHRIAAQLKLNGITPSKATEEEKDAAAAMLPLENQQVWFNKAKGNNTELPDTGFLYSAGNSFVRSGSNIVKSGSVISPISWATLFMGVPDDKENAKEILRGQMKSDVIGENPESLALLNELKEKQKEGTITPQELTTLNDLSGFTDIRTSWDKFKDGSANMVGMVAAVTMDAIPTLGGNMLSSNVVRGTEALLAENAAAKGIPLLENAATTVKTFAQRIGIPTDAQGIVNLAKNKNEMFVLMHHDNALKAMELFPDDDSKKAWYTSITDVISMALPNLLPTHKLSKLLDGETKSVVADLVGNLTTEKLDKAVVDNLMKETAKKIIAKAATFVVGTEKTAAEAALTMSLLNLGNNTTQAILKPESITGNDIANNFAQTFSSTFMDSQIIGLIGGKGEVQKRYGKVGADAIYDATGNINNVNSVKFTIFKQEKEGQLSEKQVNEKVSILNTAAELRPAVDDLQVEENLSDGQAKRVFVNLLNERLLKNQVKKLRDAGSPEALITPKENRIKEINDLTTKIIGREVTVDENYAVVDKPVENISSPINNTNESEQKINNQDGGQEVRNNVLDQSGNLQGEDASQRQPEKEVSNAASDKTGAAITVSKEVSEFSDRIAKGEKMETSEDLQFYDNNKVAIETYLTEKSKLTPTETKEWNDLTMDEKLKLAKENLPEVETLSNVDIVKIADNNAKKLLEKLHGNESQNKPAEENISSPESVPIKEVLPNDIAEKVADLNEMAAKNPEEFISQYLPEEKAKEWDNVKDTPEGDAIIEATRQIEEDKLKSQILNAETKAVEVPNTETGAVDAAPAVSEIVSSAAEKEIKPTETADNIGEGIKEPPPTMSKKSVEADSDYVGISKNSLKNDYGYEIQFPSKSYEQIADNNMARLKKSADKNGISVPQQAANEVAKMKNRKGESSEHDIITAAFHLMNLNEAIKKTTDNEVLDGLLSQQQDALEALRQLGNNAGRNLNLFGALFKKVSDDSIDIIKRQIQKDLDVKEIPRTLKDLNESDLSAHDKKRVRPYVEAIEKLTKDVADIQKKTKATIEDIDEKALKDYVDNEIAKNKKSKPSTAGKETKEVSEKRKTAADKLRKWADKFEEFGKADLPEGTETKGISIDVQKMVANAMRFVADEIEAGKKIPQIIKDAVSKFGENVRSHIQKGLSENGFTDKEIYTDKEQAINKLTAIRDNEKTTNITKDMVSKGIIDKVVNEHIKEDTPYDKVISEATKELKEHLPDVTGQDVKDAILRKGEFSTKSKQKEKSEFDKKKEDVKRVINTENKVNALTEADEIHSINSDESLSKEEKKKEIEQRKSDYEKGLDKKLSDHEADKKKAAEDIKIAQAEQKKTDIERNRQFEKIDNLKNKLSKLQAGIRETKEAKEVKVDTPEIEDLKKQVKDADDALRKIESDQRKANSDAQSHADKLNSITQEIDHVNRERAVFNRAIKDPKTTSDELKAAKTQLDEAYSRSGIRKETGSKTEIKIAKDAETAIDEINNSDLPEDVKKEHIAEIEKNRDEQLNNTKQGVLTNLRDNVGYLIEDITSKVNDAISSGDKEVQDKLLDLKKDLENLHDRLTPNTENLKDQIDKSDQELETIIRNHKGGEFDLELKDLQDGYHKSWQKTYNELETQRLIDSERASLKESQRRVNANQLTDIPTDKNEVLRNQALINEQAQTQKAWKQLNSLRTKARDENKNIADKLLSARRSFLIASFGAIEKVAGSAITKPFIDPLTKQTWGRIAGAITGVKPTSTKRLIDTYRQLKNESAANRFMADRTNKYVDTIVAHERALQSGDKDAIAATKKRMDAAELNNASALAYLFINAGSHIDIKQVMLNAATDFDAKIGKYHKSYAKERTKWQNVGYWLESVNRTHGAMKSISARQGLLDGYIENLQMAQKRDGAITPENRLEAWDMATLAEYEQGRFGEPTKLSNLISKGRSSENAAIRATTNLLFPVAKISINIAKQGIDRALPIELAFRTLGRDAFRGIKLNAQDGVEFSNFASKYYNGIKRGFDELPLEQKKYINTLLTRGLAGLGQYVLFGSLIAAGAIKYGGPYNSDDPFHKRYKVVKGSDGEPLAPGEWEFFGHRSPKLLNVVMNHSPYTLPASFAADYMAQTEGEDKKGQNGINAVRNVVNETMARLPFSGLLDLTAGLVGGDDYKLERTIANTVPSFKGTAEYLDTDAAGNPIKRTSDSKSFWGRTFDMWKTNIPGLRNTLPVKGEEDYTADQMKSPEFKMLKHYNLEPPKSGAINQYNIEKDETHPDGKMNTTEYNVFKEERQKMINEGIANIYEKGLVLEREDFNTVDIDLTNLEEVDAILKENNISKEDFKKQLDNRIKSVVDKANEAAKKLAVPDQTTGLKLKSSVKE